ncbi:hypothetical protein [Lacinutrix jangbogonensis]|uniref:hypothetical protein n=1 Tax=Lacinutrix jangbogonensis TaxID=1469557 RepID=UPI00053E0CE1|nr:hypothetical protein [Lacinutrix jangbogonensis]
MSKTLKIAIIATLLVYSCGMLYTYYSNIKFDDRVAFYDTDKNGIIDGKEITKNSAATAKQQTTRKTTKQGAIVLIPFSIIIGCFTYGITFLFRKIKSIDDNEIDYSKRKQ